MPLNAAKFLSTLAPLLLPASLFAAEPALTLDPTTGNSKPYPTLAAAPATIHDAPSSPATAVSSRYGFLDLLDHRSSYGTFWFPEPLAADEADVDNEIRFNYSHTEKRNHRFDGASAEFEHAFGLFTVEIAGGYESDRSGSGDDRETEEGFTNIELGARMPFYQYVSADNFFDSTFVFGLELSPPSESKISKDTEIVPKISNLLRLGDHFSIQTAVGISMLVGPDEGGLATLEYSAVFGYELPHDTVPVPFVLTTTPILEFDGEYAFNHDDRGNALTGIIGFHFDFQPLPFLPAQPRLGIGYMFPIDSGAREDFHWGITTSIIFEY